MIDGVGRNHFVTLMMFMNYLLEIIKASRKPQQHTTYKYHYANLRIKIILEITTELSDFLMNG